MQSLYHFFGRPFFLEPLTSSPKRICRGLREASILMIWPVQWSCAFKSNASMLTALALSSTCRFVTLSRHLISMILRSDLMWKPSICLISFPYSVHVSQPYRRLVSTTALKTLRLLDNVMFRLSITRDHRQPRDCLALLILEGIRSGSDICTIFNGQLNSLV